MSSHDIEKWLWLIRDLDAINVENMQKSCIMNWIGFVYYLLRWIRVNWPRDIFKFQCNWHYYYCLPSLFDKQLNHNNTITVNHNIRIIALVNIQIRRIRPDQTIFIPSCSPSNAAPISAPSLGQSADETTQSRPSESHPSATPGSWPIRCSLTTSSSPDPCWGKLELDLLLEFVQKLSTWQHQALVLPALCCARRRWWGIRGQPAGTCPCTSS